MKIKYLVVLLSTGLLSACGSDNNNTPVVPVPPVVTTPTLDDDLGVIIQSRGLTGDPFTDRTHVDINSDLAQLGKHLFFSKSLSGDRDVACVTCHHPMLGGGDNLSLPIGVGAENPDLLGEGRLHSSNAAHYDGGPTVPRNAPTIFNIGGWDETIFHDGRISSIGKTPNANGNDGIGIETPDSEFGIADPVGGSTLTHAQARFPVTSPEEMKGFNFEDKDNAGIREYLASRIGNYGEGAGELDFPEFWLDKFRGAFKQPTASAEQLITEQNISFAIGQYELSNVFVNSPWHDYVAGDTSALSDSAKRGAKLFFQTSDEGGADCASCHSGDFFSDEGFHNVASPQVGRGKGDGEGENDDFGRAKVTGELANRYQFRTPTLLNVAQTGPWMHSGAYTDLRQVVVHMLNTQQGMDSYDASQLTQPGVQNLQDTAQFGQLATAMDNLANPAVELNDQQIDDLVAFLHALTDPCVVDRECMAPWIAADDDNQDPNGDQLIAVDQNGDLL